MVKQEIFVPRTAEQNFKHSLAVIINSENFSVEAIVRLSDEYDKVGRYNAKLVSQLATQSISSKLTVKDLKLNRRKREIVWGRYLVTCYLRDLGLSYHKIGSYLNQKHDNVLYSYRKANELLETKDKLFLSAFNKFYELVHIYSKFLYDEKTFPSKIPDEPKSQYHSLSSRVWWNRFICSFATSENVNIT